ncbi:probable polygalacturonase At1g80170 isoform X1 [Typha angustifolia]|uniref:probable polygalacturonase At1g80170 isoform X1 n=1 Tax=Typha angustifolia TaxID=59011 RepID=UPI003C2C17EE
MQSFLSSLIVLIVVAWLYADCCLDLMHVRLDWLQDGLTLFSPCAAGDGDNGSTQIQFDVLDFQATGDGVADDTQAFLDAWLATCGTTLGVPTMIIPKDKIFLVKPVIFKGPCNSSNVNVQIDGTLVAPEAPSMWKDIDASLWLQFDSVDGLILKGSGLINGRGANWWQQSCKIRHGEGCTKLAPTAVKLMRCKDLVLSNLKLVDSPQTHVLIQGSQRVSVTNLKITAPAASPNTDGIHIHASHDVLIENTVIGTGDDCISIGDDIYHVTIQRIICGPGHGISVGSLGKGGSNASVEEISVSSVKFFNTTNGVRIKTWQGATGYAKSISFDHISFNNVANPVMIDQYYCDVRGKCPSQEKAVQISDVTYSYLSGSSKTRVAVSLNCSQNVACTGLHFESINITTSFPETDSEAFCINAHGDTKGYIHPNMSCLLQQT